MIIPYPTVMLDFCLRLIETFTSRPIQGEPQTAQEQPRTVLQITPGNKKCTLQPTLLTLLALLAMRFVVSLCAHC